MAIDRRVIHSEFLADCPQGELGHAVLLDEIDGNPNELFPGERGLGFCHE